MPLQTSGQISYGDARSEGGKTSEPIRYVYRITDTDTGEFYIGSRTYHGDCIESDDYMGSSFYWEKNPPQEGCLKKEILESGFSSEEEKYEFEFLIIDKVFKDDRNINLCNPNKNFFSNNTGNIMVFDTDNPERVFTVNRDEFDNNKRLRSIHKETVVVYNKNDESRRAFRVPVSVFRSDKSLIHVNENKVTVHKKGEPNKLFRVSKEEYKNRDDLLCMHTGTVCVYHTDSPGNYFKVATEEYKEDDNLHLNEGMVGVPVYKKGEKGKGAFVVSREEYYSNENFVSTTCEQEMTESVKDKISQSLKEYFKENDHPNSKSVEYIPTGEVFKSISSAAKEKSIGMDTILNHCKGRLAYKEYEWRYL